MRQAVFVQGGAFRRTICRVFSVRLVARPDPRMVEVPLEIEAELPRDFEGPALLASSGLPRKVKIKAPKDSVKLSTAYRADQLLGEIVKVALRGSAADVQKAQEAALKFIRTVRERRQDGATLVVKSNGRDRIAIEEQLPGGRGPQLDRTAALENRLADLEARAAIAEDLAVRVADLEDRLATLHKQLAHTLVSSEVAGPGMETRPVQIVARTPGGPRRSTAVEAFADGLRGELRVRIAGSLTVAVRETERCDKAAALAAEAVRFLGAPNDGTSELLRQASKLAAARHTGLERLQGEVDLYDVADLPVAAQLVRRLEESPAVPDPVPAVATVVQAVVQAAKGGDCKVRTHWLQRAAALCGFGLIEPREGEPVDSGLHQPIDQGSGAVVRLASPGVRRSDGSVLAPARVHLDPAARELPPEPEEAPAFPEPILPPERMPPPPVSPPPPVPESVFSEEDSGREAEVDDPDKTRPIFYEPRAAPPRPAPLEPPPPPADALHAEPPPPPVDEKARAQLPFAAPFGDLAGGVEINPDEAAAAANAASKMPKIVSTDPAHLDEALAAEVALAVESAGSEHREWPQGQHTQKFDSQPFGPDEEPADEEAEK